MSGIDYCCPDCGGSLAECHIGDAACPECGAIVKEQMDNCVPDNQHEMDYSPHFITMTFDMTDPDGRAAFENARQGVGRGLVIWELMQEMRRVTRYGRGLFNAAKEVQHREGIEMATEHWCALIYELMEAHGVTEVE